MIRKVIGIKNYFKYFNKYYLFRILKDPCGGKVFPNRADFKHCRQMFNTQKDIMQRVGFTNEVKKKRFCYNKKINSNSSRILIQFLPSSQLFFI